RQVGKPFTSRLKSTRAVHAKLSFGELILPLYVESALPESIFTRDFYSYPLFHLSPQANKNYISSDRLSNNAFMLCVLAPWRLCVKESSHSLSVGGIARRELRGGFFLRIV